jgi:hypothetical protein
VVRLAGFPDDAILELPCTLDESVENASFLDNGFWAAAEELVRRRDPHPDIVRGDTYSFVWGDPKELNP